MVAIVGSSGAGKTTLVDLIPRFYDPQEGVIRIDGVDVRSVTLASLREQIGIVSQHTVLFNDTVRNNIAYGMPGAPMEKVVEAARRANAHLFIERMPEGYGTVVGEQGLRLSGGERQRLAIARALLKDAPLLILDEATSALDTESEHVVQEALDALMRGRTTFVIAHRLSTVRNADVIFVVEDGRIVERGRHEELLSRESRYRSFYLKQFEERKAGTPGRRSGQGVGDGSPVPPREPGAPSLQPSARDGTGRRRSRLDPVGPPLAEAQGEPAGPDRTARRPPAIGRRRSPDRLGPRGIRGGDPCLRPPPSPAAPARPRRPAPRFERDAHRAGDGGQIPLRRRRRRILLSVRPSGALRAVPRPGPAGRRGDRGDRDLAQFHRRVRVAAGFPW